MQEQAAPKMCQPVFLLELCIRKTQNQPFFITPLYVCPKRIIFAHVSVPLIGF